MKLPEITSESEEGFHDLVFALASDSGPSESGQTLRAAGIHEGSTVGFQIRLGPAWKQGKIAEVNLVTYQGTVVLASLGGESDAFARVLDRLYGTKLAPAGMNAQTTFTALSLEGNPGNLAAGPVKLKLFFEPDEEDRYAEAFLNIDAEKSRISFNEKDEEYRMPLVRALGATTIPPD